MTQIGNVLADSVLPVADPKAGANTSSAARIDRQSRRTAEPRSDAQQPDARTEGSPGQDTAGVEDSRPAPTQGAKPKGKAARAGTADTKDIAAAQAAPTAADFRTVLARQLGSIAGGAAAATASGDAQAAQATVLAAAKPVPVGSGAKAKSGPALSSKPTAEAAGVTRIIKQALAAGQAAKSAQSMEAGASASAGAPGTGGRNAKGSPAADLQLDAKASAAAVKASTAPVASQAQASTRGKLAAAAIKTSTGSQTAATSQSGQGQPAQSRGAGTAVTARLGGVTATFSPGAPGSQATPGGLAAQSRLAGISLSVQGRGTEAQAAQEISLATLASAPAHPKSAGAAGRIFAEGAGGVGKAGTHAAPAAGAVGGQAVQTILEGAVAPPGAVEVVSGNFSPGAPGSAAPAAGQGAAALPGDDPSIAGQITEGLRGRQARTDQEIIIRLNPPELGRVRMVFQTEGDQVRGVLHVDSTRTYTELQHELPGLMTRLAEGGVAVRRLDIQLSPTTDHSSSDGSASMFRGDQGGQGHGPGGQRGGSGSQDERFGAPSDTAAPEQPGTDAGYEIGNGTINVWI